MRVVFAACPENGDRFTHKVVEPYWLAPAEPFGGRMPPDPDDADKIFEYGRRQASWWSKSLPHFPTGGSMLIAEMTRYSTTITSRDLA